MVQSKTKQKLQAGKPAFGVKIDTSDPFITEIIGEAGYDYIWIDGQHGPMNPNWLYETVKGLGRTDSDVIVRVVSNEHWLIGQTLDMGADGIVIPPSWVGRLCNSARLSVKGLALDRV